MVDWDTIYLALGLKMMLAIIIIAEMMIMMMEMVMMMMEAPSPRQPRWSSRRARWSRRGTRRVLRSKFSQLGIGTFSFLFNLQFHIIFYLYFQAYTARIWNIFHTFSKAFPKLCKIAQVRDTLWGFFEIEISNCNLSEIQLPEFATFFGKQKV